MAGDPGTEGSATTGQPGISPAGCDHRRGRPRSPTRPAGRQDNQAGLRLPEHPRWAADRSEAGPSAHSGPMPPWLIPTACRGEQGRGGDRLVRHPRRQFATFMTSASRTRRRASGQRSRHPYSDGTGTGASYAALPPRAPLTIRQGMSPVVLTGPRSSSNPQTLSVASVAGPPQRGLTIRISHYRKRWRGGVERGYKAENRWRPDRLIALVLCAIVVGPTAPPLTGRPPFRHGDAQEDG